MDHHPFDTWLLDQEPLNPEQAAELEAHLKVCPDCARLQAGWQGVRSAIDAELDLPVPAGFTERWNSGLQARKARARARQVRRSLFFLVIGLLLISAGLVGYVTTIGPAETMLRFFLLVNNTTSAVSALSGLIEVLLRSIHPAISITLAVSLAGWVMVLTMTWVITLLRFAAKGQTNR